MLPADRGEFRFPKRSQVWSFLSKANPNGGAYKAIMHDGWEVFHETRGRDRCDVSYTFVDETITRPDDWTPHAPIVADLFSALDYSIKKRRLKTERGEPEPSS